MPSRSRRRTARGVLARLVRVGVLAPGIVLAAVAPAAAQATSGTTAMVTEWNRVLNAAIATPGANPPTTFFTRPYAIMNVAIFDALNSIETRYQPYYVRVHAEPGASPEAAIAQAAHDTLAAMMPSQRARFHMALMASLAPIAAKAAADGAAVGAAVAREILELRRHDGWSRTPPEYVLPNVAGYWQPTPPNMPAPAFTHYPDVTAFGLDGSQHFVPAAPPTLASQQYADDFNEVKSLGSVNSTTRTADQTQMARLAAGVGTTTGPPQLWNLVLGDLARSRNLPGLETARAFALMTMATHDGFRVTMNGKYLYGLWRPVTAIREAARDGNAATEADPAWLPLITTPPYPTYPGNLTCAAIVAATVLTRTFGRDDIPFSVTWPDASGAPVATRSYNGFRQLADECARSRIWGGIHFEFDQTASKGVCEQVANYILDNQLRPF